MEKNCRGCGLNLPMDKFYKNKSKKDGLATQCKGCSRRYRERPKNKMRKKTLEQTPKYTDRAKVYRQQPKIKERLKKWYKEHSHLPEFKARFNSVEAKAWRKDYKQRPEVKARDRKLAQTSEQRAKARIYGQQPEVKSRRKESVEINRQRPEVKARRAEYNRKYRSKKLQVPYQDNLDRYFTILKRYYSYACGYCGAFEENLGTSLTVDHFVPLSKGGSHIASNLVPACMPCNLTKNAQDPIKWMTEKGINVERVGSLRANAPFCEDTIHE